MMTQIQTRRGKSIDNIISILRPATPENERQIIPISNSNFQMVQQEYDNFQRERQEYEGKFTTWHSRDVEYARMRIPRVNPQDIILSPEEINSFLQTRIVQDGAEDRQNLGLFVSMLMQHSYQSGHNNFMLDFTTASFPYMYVGAFTKGKKQHPLRATVQGNIGEFFAYGAEKVIFTVHGTITYDGSIPIIGGKGCTFKATDPRTGYVLARFRTGNKVVRICLDGTEINLRNFDDK